jgi:hypothetical protein
MMNIVCQITLRKVNVKYVIIRSQHFGKGLNHKLCQYCGETETNQNCGESCSQKMKIDKNCDNPLPLLQQIPGFENVNNDDIQE